MTRDYKKIRAWQSAKKFALTLYKNTESLPKNEMYGLTSQIRRAGVSVATNIAEGASRQHRKDYLNFLYTAKASLSETECLLNICRDLGYLNQKDLEHLDRLHLEAAKSLYGLIRSVEQEIDLLFSH